MNSVRFGLSVITILLLGAGYAVSQYEQLSENGNISAYVARVDAPPVRMAALLILVLAVGFALWRQPEEPEQP